MDNGDGTATDSTTGLQWELKADDGSVHDTDNRYWWSATEDGTAPDGTAFTVFLGTLNGSADGVCFAGHCDWRLPTPSEPLGLVDTSVPGCGPGPCVSIPGTSSLGYWYSSSTVSGVPDLAFALGGREVAGVDKGPGGVGNSDDGYIARAVRRAF